MKAQIPDALKADVPMTTWGKILTATPVVLTVFATLLAGLASSEMTRAQYDRGLAAQLQSKAGDQWAFFQAKRLRGTMTDLIGSVLDSQSSTAAQKLDQRVASLAKEEPFWGRSDVQELIGAAQNGRLPSVLPPSPENVSAAQKLVDEPTEPGALVEAFHRVSHDVLDAEIDRLRAAVRAADARATAETVLWRDMEAKASLWPAAERANLKAARLDFDAQRYADEARMNQRIAQAYELKVKKVNLSAERHHLRSVRFFYGMLAAQVSVIVSTLALAAKAKNWLWSMAAFAGVVAFALAMYVHLYL